MARRTTRDEFVRLVRSFRARIRAGMARTPAERAALPWDLIIADADQRHSRRITRSQIGGGSGWTAAYDAAQMYVPGGWHTVPMYYFGMADT